MTAIDKNGQLYWTFEELDFDGALDHVLVRARGLQDFLDEQYSLGADNLITREAELKVRKYLQVATYIERLKAGQWFPNVPQEYYNSSALKGLSPRRVADFYRVHRKHVAAWESEARIQQHSLANVKKVVWVPEEKCFHVFFKRTKKFSAEWYHCTLTGDWY